MSDDARRVRAALAEPLDVARRLGLLDGAKWQAGGGLLVRCPNGHDKRAPSCSLTVGADGTLRAHCFGACGLTGDVFTLVAASEGLDTRRDFRAVFLRAAELAGVEASGPSTSRKWSAPAPSPRRAPLPPTHDASRFDALARAILAAGALDAPSSADVASYLDGRGLLALARADGWAALPPFDAVDGAELRASGLALPSGEAWAHAAHRVCIPWRGLDGAIATIQRRRCDAATGERYALPSGRAPSAPYGAEALARAPRGAAIVIVEGAADVLAARALARGPIVALGLPGVGAWRASWATLATGRRVLVALDADAAGDRSADVLARDLAAAGASHVERVRPPAKDWCDALASRRRAA